MTQVIKAVGSLIGIGGSPKVDTSAADKETGDAQNQANAARGALFETAGGAAGSDLSPQQIASSRSTLFGN